MIEREATPAVGVIILNKDKVLLVRHTEKAKPPTGTYGFPAGKIEKGETEKQAAVRELKEETGLITSEEDLMEFPGNAKTVTLYLKSGPTRFQFTVFICGHYRGELQEAEATVPEWIGVESLVNTKIIRDIPDFVKNAKKFLNETQS